MAKTKTYIFNWGKHARRGPGGVVCYDTGDTIQLTEDEAARLGAQISPSGEKAPPATPPPTKAEPEAQPEPDPEQVTAPEPSDDVASETPSATAPHGIDLSGHWSAVSREVRAMESADQVRGVLADEQAGKARDSVLTAATERLTELEG